MLAACEEFTAEELAYALAEHRGRAEDLLTLAATLQTRLPGTRAALRDGSSGWTRRRSSPMPSPTSTPAKPGRPRPWCWAGPAV